MAVVVAVAVDGREHGGRDANERGGVQAGAFGRPRAEVRVDVARKVRVRAVALVFTQMCT
eukprot:6204542-Pleurochrysis_carterae.AAC.1